MSNVFGIRKTVSMVSKLAKEGAKNAANAIITAANKGALASSKKASPKSVNVKARKAAKAALRRIKNAA
jgi:hypothetical protein